MNKLTMNDIARQVGVSKMTISRYFNGGYVSDAVRAQIDPIIKASGYTPNKFAQSMRTQSNIIGFIAPRIESYTASKVIKGVLAAANKYQLRVLFHATGFDHNSELITVHEFQGLNALGTIVIASKETIAEPYYRQFDNVIFIGKEVTENCSLYYPERRALFDLIYTVTQHLSTIKKCVYVYDERMLSGRLRVINELMAEQFSALDFCRIALPNTESVTAFTHLQLSADHIYFCATDEIALKLYRLVKQQGLTIGKDIWISGIGDYNVSDLVVPSLTSIAFSYYDVGYHSVLKLVDKDYQPYEGSYELKIRESTERLK